MNEAEFKHLCTQLNSDSMNLEILAEECAEVIRIKSKIVRFGLDDYHPKNGAVNRQSLEEEIGHVLFMVYVLVERGILSEDNIDKAIEEKASKIMEWYLNEKDN